MIEDVPFLYFRYRCCYLFIIGIDGIANDYYVLLLCFRYRCYYLFITGIDGKANVVVLLFSGMDVTA